MAERTPIRARPSASELFDAAFAAVAGDPRCVGAASAVRTHSVEVACLARELAPLVGSPQGPAFAAGLLHDIGELLLMRRAPSAYVEMLDAGLSHQDQLAWEKQTFGTDHALLGAEHLLDRRVIDEIAAAVADHHGPFAGSEPTTLVAAGADALATCEVDPAAIVGGP